jgi:hypothetical protein
MPRSLYLEAQTSQEHVVQVEVVVEAATKWQVEVQLMVVELAGAVPRSSEYDPTFDESIQ